MSLNPMLASGGVPAAAIEEARFAATEVPAYRTLLSDCGLSAPLHAESFFALPCTDKAFFRRHYPYGVLAEQTQLPQRSRYRSQSSGTSSERLTSVTPRFVLAQRMLNTARIHPRLGELFLRPGAKKACRYAAPNCSDVECATPQSTIADRTLSDGTLVLPVRHDLLATEAGMVHQAADELEEAAPDWLYCDPTHLAFLIRRAPRKLRLPSLRAVVTTYTYPTQVARRQIREAFPDALVTNLVSMSELGWLALECDQGALHLNVENFFVELLVGDRRAQDGELAELVVTSIGDRLCPRIRYRTGDYYRGQSHRCACGYRGPVVRHQGRRDHFLMRDGSVLATPAEVDDAVGLQPAIDVYALEQRAERSFTFSFIANDSWSAPDAEQIAERLQSLLGHGARIELKRCTYIAGTRSGKFASCKSRVRERRLLREI